MSQADAQRVGICLTDYEQFWWRADEGEACPACSTDDDGYEQTHIFFVRETKGGDARRRGEAVRYERDYIERTIATVRNHREADNCWPQWANIFADEIEALWAENERLRAAVNLVRREVLLPEYIAVILGDALAPADEAKRG